MNPEEIRVNSFLRLGYFVDYEQQRCPIDFSGIDKHVYSDVPREELVRLGAEKLRETFSEIWSGGRTNVVPLSGGLDSRLILGALLEHTDANELHTYTFGIPGSYDFEIGNAVAGETGTRHVPIDLSSESYCVEKELGAGRRTDCQGVLFHHPPLSRLDDLYPNAVYWSGYVGDAVAGSHLHDPPSASLEGAKRLYLRNRTFVRSIRLQRCADEEILALIGGGRLNPKVMTWDEQVLFDEACAKFTAPLVLFHGHDYLTPLINTPWMDFMFSVPNRYRFGEKLMIDIGRATFPELFSLPSKNCLGHTFVTPNFVVKAEFWMNKVRKLTHQFFPWVNYPNTQYNDFNEGIRSNPSLRRIVRDSVEDLRQRGICDWIDFAGIWRRHDRRLRNHGDALIVLSSLELNLKAMEQASSG